MNGFFAITLFIAAAGVVSGCKRMEVKRGDKVVLVEKKSGLETLRRVTLSKASVDCKPVVEIILDYCSPKENASGCINKKNSSTFSFYIGKDIFSLTPLNASDGYYVASITFGNNNVKKISIVVNGTLPSTISPDPPPSQENPEARETPRTVDLSILVIIAVCSAVGIIAVCILAWWCLKKKKNNESEASDCKKDYIKESAGEQTTGDSFEMLDRAPPSEDEDSNNLNEVLIHVPSAGQENERPGQHLQNNNYSEDDNSKHNNTNNDCDSDFCSNDEDYEIKSNNTNNYLNNNNNDDGVANGGGDDDDDDDDDGISRGDDDDGISRGDDSIKTN